MIEFIIISALSIVGLFQVEKSMSPIDQSRIHPQIKTHVRSFERTFNVKISGVSADFYVPLNKKSTAVGTCYESVFYTGIRLDYDWWLWASDDAREQLVWHEIAHCFFKIDHDNTKIYDYPIRGKSIMYRFMMPDSVYKTFRRHYIKDLKQKIDEIQTYRPEGIL